MLGFMDHIQQAYYGETNWNTDNSYGSLTATARAILSFPTPQGLRLTLSSLATPQFATSYTLNTLGLVSGSVSYLYTSSPLYIPHSSPSIPLQSLITGYRSIQPLHKQDEAWHVEEWRNGRRVDRPATLLYGHLHLPSSYLSGLYLRRLSPQWLLKISTVSSSELKNGGAALTLLSRDVGKYSTEFLFSTDGALLGARGLWNFGAWPQRDSAVEQDAQVLANMLEESPTLGSPSPFTPLRTTQLSAGAELYYGLWNKSGGISTGLRLVTLPNHPGFPYTMTLTLNPLMGNLSSSYAVKAGNNVTLCSSFDFNVYSYESDLQVGLELWRQKRSSIKTEVVDGDKNPIPDPSSAQIAPKPALPPTMIPEDKSTAGVLKTCISNNSAISLLWEGRFKELFYSAGIMLDFKRAGEGAIFRGVGIEIGYCS
ncbi:Mitochondrial distribution and morphology protein 10 [Agyrium rufum]|nr:Mitochondrial distribution and morphology protein 10 [Agyrium rufum]